MKLPICPRITPVDFALHVTDTSEARAMAMAHNEAVIAELEFRRLLVESVPTVETYCAELVLQCVDKTPQNGVDSSPHFEPLQSADSSESI